MEMAAMTLTPEQERIREAARDGAPGKVVAYAGSGKTSTLREIALARPQDRTLYLAFNKTTADEAKGKMPPHVESRTTHSLAFAGTAKWRGYRPGPQTDSRRQSPRATPRWLDRGPRPSTRARAD